MTWVRLLGSSPATGMWETSHAWTIIIATIERSNTVHWCHPTRKHPEENMKFISCHRSNLGDIRSSCDLGSELHPSWHKLVNGARATVKLRKTKLKRPQNVHGSALYDDYTRSKWNVQNKVIFEYELQHVTMGITPTGNRQLSSLPTKRRFWSMKMKASYTHELGWWRWSSLRRRPLSLPVQTRLWDVTLWDEDVIWSMRSVRQRTNPNCVKHW